MGDVFMALCSVKIMYVWVVSSYVSLSTLRYYSKCVFLRSRRTWPNCLPFTRSLTLAIGTNAVYCSSHYHSQDFEFSGRCRYVTDNAASMKAAFRQKDWAGCTCHQLNLVVQATLQVNDDELPLKKISEATKTVIRYLKKSK